MKKILLKSMLLIAGLFGSITANAYDFEVNGIYYNKTSETTVEVSKNGGNSYSGSVVIPASVTNGATIYSITSIGISAFSKSTSLASVEIPNSVTKIGESAFSMCESLTSIEIPNSVTEIGRNAFNWCTSLEEIIVASENPNYSDLDGVLFNKNQTTLVAYPNAKSNTYTIPNSVTKIGVDAFGNCFNLTSVTIPNSVTEIGEEAFYQCMNLASVTIGNSVKKIGGWAFCYCNNLTSITIPNSVTEIGEEAFKQCVGLTSIEIPNSVTEIGKYTFLACTGLTSVTIPNSVTKIGEGAFYGCTELTEIYNYSNTPQSITANVFQNVDKSTCNLYVPAGCTYAYRTAEVWKEFTIEELKCSFEIAGIYYRITSETDKKVEVVNGPMPYSGDVVIPTSVTYEGATYSVTSIGDNAFNRCADLTSITIPNSVTSIDYWAFSGCTSLTSVTIPNSVYSIGESAFGGCTGLTSVTIGNSVTGIDNNAFSNCTGLTNVTIPNSVLKIGYFAFSGCTGLTSVTIPKSVIEIDAGLFAGCTGLKEYIVDSESPFYSALDGVLFNKNQTRIIAYPAAKSSTTYTIPNSVTSIERFAFNDCKGLTNVTIPNSVTKIDEFTFDGCTGLTSVTIPNSVTEIGVCAFYECTDLTSVTIGNSVTEIGRQAFFGCIGLTSITIPNSVTKIGEQAFQNCTGLTSVTISSSVTEIGSSAFYGCTSLKEIYNYSEEPQEITMYVFNNVNKSTCTLYVPAGCADAYRAADVWKEFNIEEIKSNIEIAGIYYNITSEADKTVAVTYRDNNYNSYSGDVVIPASVTIGGETYSVTEIGKDAFSYCDDLASVTIPNSITKIGEQTFSGCTSLACVIIPKSVKEISPTAFSGCTGLEEIYNYSEEPQQVANVFANVNIPNCKLYVPTGYAQTYRTAEIWKDFDIQEFTPTGVEAVTDNEVKIAIVGNTITINGAAEAAKVTVYGINGELVYSGVAKSITVPAHGVYIVRVASVTKKVTF